MKQGILEEACGGTVMLDEIGEMALGVQPQLLRALEGREITRLGSRTPVPVDFRIVAATNRDLRQFCEEGRFRHDLFFRLACVTIRLPALRERTEDIPLLAEHFVRQCAGRHGIEAGELTREALDALAAHPWPGNVRELRNVMEAATVMSRGGAIGARHVRQAGCGATLAAAAPAVAPAASVLPSPVGAPAIDLPEPGPDSKRLSALEAAERRVIATALQEAGWNKRKAARALGISHTTLLDRVRRYGLVPPPGSSEED